MTASTNPSTTSDREYLRQQEIDHQLKNIRSNISSVRAAAARRLGELKAGVESLLAATVDPSDNVRIAAAIALGSFSGSEQQEEIVEALLTAIDDPSERVCQFAIRSLGLLRAENTREEVEEFLDDSNLYIVGAAILALGRMNAVDLAPRLAEFLDHESRYLQTQAIRAVMLLDYQPAGHVLVNLLKKTRQARQSANELDPQAFLEHREDDLYTMMNQLVRAAGEMNLSDAMPILIDIAQKDVGLRGLAVEALINIGGDFSLDLLTNLLSDPSAQLRRRILNLIVRKNYRQVLPILRNMLEETSAATRSAALQAVTMMNDLESIPRIEWMSLFDNNPFTRIQAVHSLTSLLGSQAGNLLLPLTRDANFEVRRAAVYHLLQYEQLDSEYLAALACFAQDFPEDELSTTVLHVVQSYHYDLDREGTSAQKKDTTITAQIQGKVGTLRALLEDWQASLPAGDLHLNTTKTRVALAYLLEQLT